MRTLLPLLQYRKFGLKYWFSVGDTCLLCIALGQLLAPEQQADDRYHSAAAGHLACRHALVQI
jgi:hypothetical protein